VRFYWKKPSQGRKNKPSQGRKNKPSQGRKGRLSEENKESVQEVQSVHSLYLCIKIEINSSSVYR